MPEYACPRNPGRRAGRNLGRLVRPERVSQGGWPGIVETIRVPGGGGGLMARRVGPEEGSLGRRGVWLAAGLALAVALPVRLLPLLGADFPLNDGGLFGAMGPDPIDSGVKLPLTTSYNNGTVPFAYPPFAI